MADSGWRQRLDFAGFAILPAVLPDATVSELSEAMAVVGTGGNVAGVRDLLRRIPAVRQLAASDLIRSLVEPVLGVDARSVRGLFFDKTAGANWLVPWHQDLTIAVRERRHVEGYGPWSVKEGVPHVQPPAEVLERMLTVRLHLDDCGIENGPLEVLAGTHRLSRLAAESCRRIASEQDPVTCEVARGGVLLMRPLLMHRSAAAVRPGHRRVIHIEYAVGALAGGLEWWES